ncbi:MAG: hypothetical protein AAF413_02845 [Patescibacteria group bacterium]
MDKIQTLHPDPGKQGVNIDKEKYDIVKTALLETISENEPKTFMKLGALPDSKRCGFEGSAMWSIVTVKLDLEARGILVHHRNKKPAIIELVNR